MTDREETPGRAGTGDAGDDAGDTSVGAGAISGASMGDVGRVGLGGPGAVGLGGGVGGRELNTGVGPGIGTGGLGDGGDMQTSIGDDQNASAGAVGADTGGEGGKGQPPGSAQD